MKSYYMNTKTLFLLEIAPSNDFATQNQRKRVVRIFWNNVFADYFVFQKHNTAGARLFFKMQERVYDV